MKFVLLAVSLIAAVTVDCRSSQPGPHSQHSTITEQPHGPDLTLEPDNSEESISDITELPQRPGFTFGTEQSKETTSNITEPLWLDPEEENELSESELTELRDSSRWPEGYYGLPDPRTHCPTGWDWGQRYHDTEDNRNRNSWSTSHHFSAYLGTNIKLTFCMKNFGEGPSWPAGNYCIYKSGWHCPAGFYDGNLHLDDEDSRNNNWSHGHLPAGSYDHNTRYYYCCRGDGRTSNAITLPTAIPFYLFPYRYGCQRVSGMVSTMEYIQFDTEDSDDQTRASGNHPKMQFELGHKNPTIYFCYYRKE